MMPFLSRENQGFFSYLWYLVQIQNLSWRNNNQIWKFDDGSHFFREYIIVSSRSVKALFEDEGLSYANKNWPHTIFYQS